VNDVQVYVEEIFGTSGAADCEALVNPFLHLSLKEQK
jgi:hypothetical protein